MKRRNEDIGNAGSSSGAKDKRSRTDSTKNEDTDLHQGALLPTLKDPKLWLVKCVSGREREAAICLLQKFIDHKSDLKIMSIIAVDTLKNFIYVEAEKEHHVRQACKGMRNIYSSAKITMVPMDEMTQVLSLNKSKKSGEGSSSAVSICQFKIGQPVVITSGDLRNVQGSVVKLEEETVYIKPKQFPGLPESLAFNYKQLRKFFEVGNRVKIVAGVEDGQKGMVLKVDGEVLTVLSDNMREISVLANDSESL